MTPAVLAELLDGGQSFRWWRQPDGSWLGQWSSCLAVLRIDSSGTLEWRTPTGAGAPSPPELAHYLGGDAEQAAALDRLPWRSDAHLARCMAAFPNLRLLRQPLGETLLAFLCSATKQIVQIKQMLGLLAARFGQPVPLPDGPGAWVGVGVGSSLPTWEQLAVIPENELRACLLGFRARFIRATAERLAAEPDWLPTTGELSYPEAKERLCSLPGVGAKVADCVLLFGAGRLEAFPVDVWILKAMARRYGLEAWPTAHVAQFGRVHFGAAAGLAQQFLFAYERAAARAERQARAS